MEADETKDAVSEIKRMLDIQGATPAQAVFLCGDRDCPKDNTGLGYEVIADLQDDLKKGQWKQVMVTSNEPDKAKKGSASDIDIIRAMRLEILKKLNPRKEKKDLQRIEEDGYWQKRLSECLIEAKQVFIFIANVPSSEVLKRIFPKEATLKTWKQVLFRKILPKKCIKRTHTHVRVLLTTYNKNAVSALKDSIFQRRGLCVMKPLSYDEALQVFGEKLPDKTDALAVTKIIMMCKGEENKLKIVMDYLIKYFTDDEAFGRLSEWIRRKDPSFSELMEYFNCEERFAHLSPLAKDALLDLCSFYSDWEWDKAASVLDSDVLEKLRELELVKREEGMNRISVPENMKTYCLSRSQGSRITSANDLHVALAERKFHAIKGVSLLQNKIPFFISAHQLDQMDSLRMLELGDWTIVESKCQGMFTDLRYFQAGSRVQNLPFDITRLDNLRFLDNNSQQSMGIVPNKVPSSLRIVKSMDLQLCQYINMNKLPKACKLKTLDIRGSNLQMLPETFSELDALEEIFLSKCYRLKILRDSFANLRSLNMLDLSHCAALRCLPSSFGWLSSLERVNFSYCTGLKHLPESIGLLSSVKEIDLSYCKRIKKLPKDLVKLSTLRVLKLKACTHLLELPQGFQSLSLEELSLESCNRLKLLPEEIQSTSKQKTVSLSWCFTVEELSKGFINLIKPSVEHLILADCIGLKTLPEELPAELSGLKSINLSGCINLLSLPKRFHKLQYLEKLDLSSCERLEEDSIRLGRLSSLKEVNLSKCKGLKGSCLTNLSRISSLTFVDIRGSPYLADHWNQMRKENKIFHLTAATGSPGVGCRSFFPSLAKSLDFEKELHLGTLEFFHDKWPFVDFDGSQFYPSTLKTGTTLGVIFDHDYAKEEVQELEKILNDLRATSHCFQIFHVGNLVSSFGKELTRRLRVWTSDNYEAHVFFQKALSTIESYDEKRRYAMIICNVQKLKAGKGFSTWTSITNDSLKVTTVDVPKEELFRLKELTESPQESNLKTLKALLLTKDINFLITRRNQMEINNLEGKFVFLLFSWLHKFEEEKTAFKDVYEELKILIEMKPVFEVVWIPIVIEGRDTRALHANSVLEIPWPSIADPWSISPNAMQLFRKHPGFNKLPLLTVVYPDGKLCFENIIPKAKQFEEETIKKLEEMIKIEEEALKCLDAERKSERAEENEVEEEGAERKEIIKNLEKKIMAEKKKVVARNIYRIIKEREEKICSTR